MATDAPPAKKAKEKTLTLYSSDNQKFEVKESVAMQSVTLKNMIKDSCADNSLQIPDVTSVILAKVIEYCNKHAAAGATAEPNKSAEDELKIFDADFVKVEQATLCDLILAANYLEIKGLRDLTCQTIADTIKGKLPKENHNANNIKNDLPIPSTHALATTKPSEQKQIKEARFKAFLVHWEKTAKERLRVHAMTCGSEFNQRHVDPRSICG